MNSSRTYRQKHKELGLCGECSRPTENGRYRCPVCAGKRAKRRHIPEINYRLMESSREYNASHRESERLSAGRQREERRRDNKCIRCGAPLMDDETGYCMGCITKGKIPIRSVNGRKKEVGSEIIN